MEVSAMEMRVTLSGVVAGQGFVLEVSDETERRFRECRLKKGLNTSRFMGLAMEWLETASGPTETQLMRYLDHVEHVEGYSRLPMPTRKGRVRLG
jgi:hypothetical protein